MSSVRWHYFVQAPAYQEIYTYWESRENYEYVVVFEVLDHMGQTLKQTFLV